jgi:hypothetical protein
MPNWPTTNLDPRAFKVVVKVILNEKIAWGYNSMMKEMRGITSSSRFADASNITGRLFTTFFPVNSVDNRDISAKRESEVNISHTCHVASRLSI